MAEASVRVDVWSDFVCPWCFLASTSLEKLESEQKIEIVWRSYELRPKGSPPMLEAYRQRIEAGRPQMVAMALERYGIKMTHGPFGVDSRAAHIGAKYAEEQGVGKEYHNAMFRAYWQDARAIDQQDVLLDVAEPSPKRGHGLGSTPTQPALQVIPVGPQGGSPVPREVGAANHRDIVLHHAKH